MAFSQATKDAAYARAGGRCECTMRGCPHHHGRCNATLRGGWHAHHRVFRVILSRGYEGDWSAKRKFGRLMNVGRSCRICYRYFGTNIVSDLGSPARPRR